MGSSNGRFFKYFDQLCKKVSSGVKITKDSLWEQQICFLPLFVNAKFKYLKCSPSKILVVFTFESYLSQGMRKHGLFHMRTSKVQIGRLIHPA